MHWARECIDSSVLLFQEFFCFIRILESVNPEWWRWSPSWLELIMWWNGWRYSMNVSSLSRSNGCIIICRDGVCDLQSTSSAKAISTLSIPVLSVESPTDVKLLPLCKSTAFYKSHYFKDISTSFNMPTDTSTVKADVELRKFMEHCMKTIAQDLAENGPNSIKNGFGYWVDTNDILTCAIEFLNTRSTFLLPERAWETRWLQGLLGRTYGTSSKGRCQGR